MLSGSGFTKIVFLQVRTDSFWDKMGTLGRKKKVAEVQQVEVEGKHDIDSPGFVLLFFLVVFMQKVLNQVFIIKN